MDNVIFIAQVERERQAQGLPAKVADGTALRRIACLVITKAKGGGGDA